MDFPGFDSPNDWEEQLVNKLLFYDILTQHKTKLAIVLN